jgi:predicted glycosyltransferase
MRALDVRRRAPAAEALVWIDIENPPQVQYLLPVARALRARARTVVTAREYGDTLELLRASGESVHAIGHAAGRSKIRKAVGVLRRSSKLASFFAVSPHPSVALCVSRPAVLAARRLGVPRYVPIDYEHADMTVYRLATATILYPDVIDPETFLRRGIAEERLHPYRGLKEDLTFAGVDVKTVPPARFESDPDHQRVRVLFRPPAEESHYYRQASGSLTRQTLRYLSEHERVMLVFSPRHAYQSRFLEGLRWRHEPVILGSPLPALSLLTAADLVVSSGGTMLREAAYLGIPAYSIFQSEIGAVDRYLESIGRASLLSSEHDLGKIQLQPRTELAPLRVNPGLVDELASVLLEAAVQHSSVG